MLVCRTFTSPNLPKTLHVHDEPSKYADIQRNAASGWSLSTTCQLPGIPFQHGDINPSIKVIADLVRR